MSFSLEKGVTDLRTLVALLCTSGEPAVVLQKSHYKWRAGNHLQIHKSTQGVNIKFVSESQAALQALESNNCTVQTVKDTKMHLTP